MKMLTIAKDGKPIEPAIPLANDAIVDAYLRQRFSTEDSRHVKMRGYVWFEGQGASRMVFDSADPDVIRALPKSAGLVFFVDSEDTFAAMSSAGGPAEENGKDQVPETHD